MGALALSFQSMLLVHAPGKQPWSYTITLSMDDVRRRTRTECSRKFLVSIPKIPWFVIFAAELTLMWLEIESKIMNKIVNYIYGLVCRSTEKERDLLA